MARLLFASNEDMLTDNLLEAVPKAEDISKNFGEEHFHNIKLLQSLANVVLALCMAEGFDEDLSLSLDDLEDHSTIVGTLTARLSFTMLALLLQGPSHKHSNSRQDFSEASKVAAVSAWGWSLCLGSLTCYDPSDAKPEITFVRGVPARGAERKHYVLDGSPSLKKEMLSNWTVGQEPEKCHTSGPGQQYTLSSWTRSDETRHFTGINDDAFEVTHIFTCRASDDVYKTGVPYSITCGPRSMQEASWAVHHTPNCEHPVSLGQSTILPEGVWVFEGWRSPLFDGVPQDSVFAGSVAGDHSARWILIALMLYRWKAETGVGHSVCVRSRECCVECAVRFAKSCYQDHPVGLVL